jgi:hypothetical protein
VDRQGKFTWASGNMYEGDFDDSKMRTRVFVEVTATTDSKEGQSYDVVFADGNEVRNGFLVYTFKFSLHGQVVKEGEFSNGKFIK